ncbi:F-box protein [Venturia inaequalis]|nr:F-box protein [Venturia inaequalis]
MSISLVSTLHHLLHKVKSIESPNQVKESTIERPSTSKKAFPFFQLPLEIREIIYGWVQGSPQTKLAVPIKPESHLLFPGNILLRINKQIYTEYTHLILSTSEIALDFISRDPTPREIYILRHAHKFVIRCKIATVLWEGKLSDTPYNSAGSKPKPVFPRHPRREVTPWIKELRRNTAIIDLRILVFQGLLWTCKKHGEGEDCDHVEHLKKATRGLGRVSVGGVIEILWSPGGLGIGPDCTERAEAWMRELGRKIIDNGGGGTLVAR